MAEVSKSRWWTKLRLTFEYTDVSADPDAPIWANIAREVRLALLELGFEPLGFAHAWLKIGKAHLVHEVLVSEEGLIQAIVGEHEPAVELATLFEDGTIITIHPVASRSIFEACAPISRSGCEMRWGGSRPEAFWSSGVLAGIVSIARLRGRSRHPDSGTSGGGWKCADVSAGSRRVSRRSQLDLDLCGSRADRRATRRFCRA